MKPAYALNRLIIGLTILFILMAGYDTTVFGLGKSLAGVVAIKGYDPVAYFKPGKALKGNESISYQWNNATWYFSTKANKDLFAAAPEKYAPQYNGYCAWAMAGGRKAHTDPEVWKIVNGKLYLNCSRAAFEKWSKDIPGNIKKGDANWLNLSDKN